jgi:hypothetical protein
MLELASGDIGVRFVRRVAILGGGLLLVGGKMIGKTSWL